MVRAITRRDFVRRAAVAGAGLTFAGQLAACESTEEGSLGWGPSVLAAVFYGWQDVDAGGTAARIFYPSTEGSPQDAPILTGVGKYPLVLLLHGHCSDAPHYRAWFHLPAQLARAGFVVAVPELPATAGGAYPWDADNPDVRRVNDLRTWMRTTWPERDRLMMTPATAMVGHSYGALLGGRIVAESSDQFGAYVSLSGVWDDWTVPGRPVTRLGKPALFMHGGRDDIYTRLEGGLWDRIPAPKHRVELHNARHFDYLRPTSSTCAREQGPCTSSHILAADLTTIFISKHVWPQESGILPGYIRDDLNLPRPSLTDRQRFYDGGHLTGVRGIDRSTTCRVTITWATPEGRGSRTLGGGAA